MCCHELRLRLHDSQASITGWHVSAVQHRRRLTCACSANAGRIIDHLLMHAREPYNTFNRAKYHRKGGVCCEADQHSNMRGAP